MQLFLDTDFQRAGVQSIGLIGDEQHELSGAAKDLGSAAVFVSLVLVAAFWLAVVYDRFYA